MNILVTGGTGFIGKYFIPKLSEKNYNVTLLVRNLEKAKNMFDDKVKYIKGDVTDRNSIKDCCKDIDIVYHMVAKVGNDLPTQENFELFNKVNVEGTMNIVEEAQKHNVKKFIYVSSIAAMGIVDEELIDENSKCNPYLPYQKSKYDSEMKLLEKFEQNNFPVIILRPTKVYGIGEPEYSLLTQMKLLKKKINLIVGKSENSISNICVTDLVDGLVNCVDYGKIGNVYILSGKNSISANKFKEIMENKLNIRICTIRIPLGLMIFLSFIEERFLLLIHKRPIITVQNVKAMSKDRKYNLSKANQELNFYPKLTMEEGINMMVDWYIEKKVF